MKDLIKWIAIAVALVIIIVGAAVLYNKFSENYNANNAVTEAPNDKGEPNETENEDDGESEPALPLAPDFKVIDENGNEVKLSDYYGKPIVLNFWATWCYYCKMEMPDFNEAYKLYPEVQFLMVNATDGIKETMGAAKKYIADNGFEFDVLYDTRLDALNAYYVTSFPQTYFINERGELVTRSMGMLDLEALKKRIDMITE